MQCMKQSILLLSVSEQTLHTNTGHLTVTVISLSPVSAIKGRLYFGNTIAVDFTGFTVQYIHVQRPSGRL